MRQRSYILVLLAIACAVTQGDAQACNVPVFRYALERWPADSYQILLYHQPDSPGPAFELLQEGTTEEDGGANYALESVDVTKPEGRALAEQRGIVAYPWVEIYFPIQFQRRAAIWSGALTVDRARRILNSPVRSRLAQELLDGKVAVWILIRSGHGEKDRRALESLKSNLEWASASLEIPDTGVDVNGNPIEVADYRTYPVSFGLIEIASDDPDEDLLISALLESEPDLRHYDEPIAFPVFGKGRALYALVGDGIQRKNIREACESMLGWCSCEIKDLNPGTDLLISADWSQPFGGRMVVDPEVPLIGLSGFLEDQELAESAVPWCVPEPAAPVDNTTSTALANAGADAVPMSVPAQAPSASPVIRNLVYLAGATGLVLLVLSLWLRAKARR